MGSDVCVMQSIWESNDTAFMTYMNGLHSTFFHIAVSKGFFDF